MGQNELDVMFYTCSTFILFLLRVNLRAEQMGVYRILNSIKLERLTWNDSVGTSIHYRHVIFSTETVEDFYGNEYLLYVIQKSVFHHIFQKKTHMLWKHPALYLYIVIFLSCFLGISIDEDELHRLLAILMTLTFDLDLRTWPTYLPLDLHAKIQVCMSVRSAVRVVTHRLTDDVKNYYTRRWRGM